MSLNTIWLFHNTACARKRLTAIRNLMATGAAQSEASSTTRSQHTTCVAFESPKPPFLRVRTTNLGNATACRNSKLAPSGTVPSDTQLGPINALTDFVQGVEIYNGRCEARFPRAHPFSLYKETMSTSSLSIAQSARRSTVQADPSCQLPHKED